MTPSQQRWRDNFLRESAMRRGLVLHGNVGDVVPGPRGGWIQLTEDVDRILRERGYRRVFRWNRVHGVHGPDQREWPALQRAVMDSDTTGGTSGTPYDMGGPSSPAPGPGPATNNPLDFLSVVSSALRKPPADSVAFILDWTEYLFGQVNSLTELERSWLTLLGEATREAPLPTAVSITGPTPLVVLVCNGLSVLPPSLYTNNPAVAEIHVPVPNRQDRQAAVLSLASELHVEPPVRQLTRELEDFVDALDGLTLRDIHNITALSQQTDHLSLESLVSLYRVGEKDSPWELLNREKLADAKTTLRARVKGQDEAIEAVNRVLIRAYTGLSGLQHSQKQSSPKGALFFVGPTGVGKTELAKALASFLFGDESACLRFDMSEYNHDHADQRLVGAPPGYVGYEEGGQLTNAVLQRPFSVLLFDEIEKAHPRILDKFLQILEDGRLTDGRGKTVLFSDTVIVFTSNLGAAEISADDPHARDAFVTRVRNHFVHELGRPELLGRIGEHNIVPFNFVSDNSFLIEIARAKLEPLRLRLKEKWGITALSFEDEDLALTAIVNEIDRTSGGRGVLNALTVHLFDPLAEFLFSETDGPQETDGKAMLVVQGGSGPIFDFELE